LVEEDWPRAHGLRVEALRDAAREAGVDVSSARASSIFDAAWDDHMKQWSEGIATGARDVARQASAALGISQQVPLAHLVERFEEASHSGRVRPLPGAPDTLARLRDRGVRCGLVCDTGLTPGRVVRRHLERAGILEHLESLAFSDEVGVPKPDPRIFQAALTPLGVEPARSVHIGDLRANDIGGARKIGMTTVRIRAHHDDTSALPDADFIADDHRALIALFDD
jgi:putative hydrolase of the HAD superfamily